MDRDRTSRDYLDKAFRIEHTCVMRLLGAYIGILMQRDFDVSILQVEPDGSLSSQVIQREGAPPQSTFLLPIIARGEEDPLTADATDLREALDRVRCLVNPVEWSELQLLTERFAKVQARRRRAQVEELTANLV